MSQIWQEKADAGQWTIILFWLTLSSSRKDDPAHNISKLTRATRVLSTSIGTSSDKRVPVDIGVPDVPICWSSLGR